MSRLFRIKSDIELYLGSNSDKNCCPVFLHGGGYYFCIKVTSGKKDAVKKYFIKEWIVYTAWSLFYFALILFALRDEVFVWKDYFLQCIRNYFVFGSYYHLWYIPAMFFSAGLFYVMYRLEKTTILRWCAFFLFIIGCMGTAYYNVFIHVPVISGLLKWQYFTVFTRFFCSGVPFFTLGAEIYLQRDKLLECFFDPKKIREKTLWVCSIVVFLLFAAEQYIICRFNLMESPVDTFMLLPFVGLLFIILLRHPNTRAVRTGKVCSACSSFVYFSHPAIILVLQRIFEKVGMNTILSPTLLWGLTVAFGTIGGLMLMIAKNAVKTREK